LSSEDALASVSNVRLAPGGLVGRVQQRAHLEGLRRRVLAALAIGWLPFCALGLLDFAISGHADAILRDLSVHTRLLVAVPLLIVAEHVLGAQIRHTLARLNEEGLVSADRRERLSQLGDAATRLGTALAPDLLILLISVVAGLATLAGWLEPAGMVGAAHLGRITAERFWFSLVALPLFQFFLWRALWLWGIWGWMLLRLARIGLQYQPAHPDQRGGIGFLALPSLFFNVVFLFAISSIVASNWEMQILVARAKLSQFRLLFLAYVCIGELMAFAPLLVFTPRLFLVGRDGREELSGLATDYVRRFRQRWTTLPHGDPLGSPDIQSLNDLGGAYRETERSSRVLLFGVRDLIAMLIVMFIPMAPLILTVIPVEELLRKIGPLILGAR
jgi:hypothetical protein